MNATLTTGMTPKHALRKEAYALIILAVLITAFFVVRAMFANRTPGSIIDINTGQDVGACEAILNAEMHAAVGVGKTPGAMDVLKDGTWQGSYSSAQSVCDAATPVTNLYYAFK